MMALDGGSAQLTVEQQQVLVLAADCFARASAYFQQTIPLPEIRFDLRGACAGQAVFLRNGRREEMRIRINAHLLQRHPEEFFRQVVAHESAHIVARLIYGRRIKPHGEEWKSVMRDVLGVEPEVRHRMDVRHTTQRRHRYRCACSDREHALSTVRHNRVQRQQQIYLCRSCRQPLSYLG